MESLAIRRFEILENANVRIVQQVATKVANQSIVAYNVATQSSSNDAVGESTVTPVFLPRETPRPVLSAAGLPTGYTTFLTTTRQKSAKEASPGGHIKCWDDDGKKKGVGRYDGKLIVVYAGD